MTKEEAMFAAKERKPVICNGIRYKRISALIFRYLGDRDRETMATGLPSEVLFVELEDWHARSRTVANPSEVEADGW